VQMATCRSRECCGGQWAQRSVSTRFQSPTLCSPTSPVSAPWSRELASFDVTDDTTPLCSPTSPVSAPWSRNLPSFDDTPVPSDKKRGTPVRLLHDAVSAKKKKKINVPPMRVSGDRHYVDASKFNPTYVSEHMALSIPIAKCSTKHVSSETPISEAPYSMQAEKDIPTFENSDVLNTTDSSACNYVKQKKKRGERKTKDAVCGSDAVIFALKHKVRSLQ